MSIHPSAVDPPTGRRTHRPKKVTATVLASALLVAALAPLAAQPANAALVAVGPISEFHGYPEWFDDGTVKLQLCYEENQGCLVELPNPGQPVSYPDNWSVETFYFAAEAEVGDIGMYEAALEATHNPEVVANENQIAFGRLRFRFDGLQPNHDYTVAHPYGTNVLTSDGEGVINETFDEGCGDAPCNWDAVAEAFLGQYADGSTANFLQQTTAPAGTIGDIDTPTTVTGAPSGVNAVIVTDESGTVVAETTQFGVMGRIADVVDGAPSTPNLADASDTGRSTTDNITNDATPTLTGTATAGATVELIVDGAGTGITTVATGGVYSFTLATALADGSHRFQARIADPVAGNLTSGTLQVLIDTAPPTATIIPPFPSSPSADTTPTFSFSSNEATATFECQLLPTNSVFSACTSPHTWDAQLNGAYTFNVRAVDQAGNIGAAATRSIQIGTTTTPPPVGSTTEQKDMTSDGNPDVVARDSAGRLWLYPGNGTGGFRPRTQIGTGWNIMSAILQPGDWNGDGRADLMARDTSGRLWLYRGNGAGGVAPRVQVGAGWNVMTTIVTPGDFNGDSRSDLIARDSSGRLFLYPGNGTGGFNARLQIGSGWNIMTSVFGSGDWNGDGRADLMARDGAGRLFLYPGNGRGGFAPRSQPGAGWNIMTAIRGAGHWDAGTTADLLARDSSGRLWLYRGGGAGGFGTRTQVGAGWNGYTIVQ